MTIGNAIIFIGFFSRAPVLSNAPTAVKTGTESKFSPEAQFRALCARPAASFLDAVRVGELLPAIEEDE